MQPSALVFCLFPLLAAETLLRSESTRQATTEAKSGEVSAQRLQDCRDQDVNGQANAFIRSCSDALVTGLCEKMPLDARRLCPLTCGLCPPENLVELKTTLESEFRVLDEPGITSKRRKDTQNAAAAAKATTATTKTGVGISSKKAIARAPHNTMVAAVKKAPATAQKNPTINATVLTTTARALQNANATATEKVRATSLKTGNSRASKHAAATATATKKSSAAVVKHDSATTQIMVASNASKRLSARSPRNARATAETAATLAKKAHATAPKTANATAVNIVTWLAPDSGKATDHTPQKATATAQNKAMAAAPTKVIANALNSNVTSQKKGITPALRNDTATAEEAANVTVPENVTVPTPKATTLVTKKAAISQSDDNDARTTTNLTVTVPAQVNSTTNASAREAYQQHLQAASPPGLPSPTLPLHMPDKSIFIKSKPPLVPDDTQHWEDHGPEGLPQPSGYTGPGGEFPYRTLEPGNAASADKAASAPKNATWYGIAMVANKTANTSLEPGTAASADKAASAPKNATAETSEGLQEKAAVPIFAKCSTFRNCPDDLMVDVTATCKKGFCDADTCCFPKRAFCKEFEGCAEFEVLQPDADIRMCPGRDVSSCGQECCVAAVRCQFFTACDEHSSLNAVAYCRGNLADDCDQSACCLEHATCDLFEGCEGDLILNAPQHCSGLDSSTCDQDTCCKAP